MFCQCSEAVSGDYILRPSPGTVHVHCTCILWEFQSSNRSLPTFTINYASVFRPCKLNDWFLVQGNEQEQARNEAVFFSIGGLKLAL